MPIKKILKENRFTSGVYSKLKHYNDNRKKNAKFNYNGKFINRSKGYSSVCIILAGYKEYLYNSVFDRLKRFAPNDIDICVITSGKYSKTIDSLCEHNNWSYLSTKENNVSLVQNVAILHHPKAKYIYKLDEDIFITRDYFKKMMQALNTAKKSEYNPGFIAPLIPINGFSHLILLKKLDLVQDYERRFETPLYMTGDDRQIQSNPEVAKYFWGEGGLFPHIDDINDKLSHDVVRIIPCPIRFSIGAILFERAIWEDMGYFEIDRYGNSMGVDETQICSYCMRRSRPIMVSENTLVGHFSFGPQTKEMIEYYQNNLERFSIKEQI